MTQKKYTDEQKRQAVELYLDQGATVAADQIGCTRQAIYGWLGEYGIDTANDEEKRLATAARHVEKRAALAEAFLDQSLTMALAADATDPLSAQRLMTTAAIASQKFLEIVGGNDGKPTPITMGQIESEITRLEGELGNENDLDRSLRQSVAEMERRIRSDYDKEMTGKDRLGRPVRTPELIISKPQSATEQWNEAADTINGDRPPTEGA